jgi:hypothetical protein
MYVKNFMRHDLSQALEKKACMFVRSLLHAVNFVEVLATITAHGSEKGNCWKQLPAFMKGTESE